MSEDVLSPEKVAILSNEEFAEVVEALEAARDAVEYSIEVHGTDHGGMMLAALNKIDVALSKVTS